MFRQLRWRIGTIWCSLTHESLMWPVHGHYECRTCGRRYLAFSEAPIANWTKHAALRPAVPLLLAVALATFARPAHTGEVLKGHDPVKAETALERYTAGGGPDPWTIESIEIHACVPKLEKSGSLRAIRRLAPIGESRYEVLQLAGDRTVEEQVILRYLNALERESKLPAASIAITPANYKFVYKGVVDDSERPPAYAFQITPLRKRDGLIKGELWLEQGTGVPVLQFGHLVRSPSVFIRRVSISRENVLRDAVVESRLTHITVETRLIGRAELVIEERPLRSADAVQFAGWENEGGQQ
jgi:hypothetical protein